MMAPSDDLDLAHLKLADIMSYLTSTGWEQIKYDDRRTLIFTKPDGQAESPFVIALPYTEQFRDYSARIEEALERLAVVEDSSFDAVLRKVQSVRDDVIYLRLMVARDEYPSLERASHFIEGMRDLVAWGACMEREQQRYFVQPFHEAREQTEHFHLAHTYHGSFGFTIESQVSEAQQLAFWSDQQPLPLQRRVLERITRGFLLTQQAEERQSAEILNEQFAQGFNGNMCKAVLEMLEDIREGQVAYAVRWSTSVPASQDVAAFAPIVLQESSIYYLQSAAAYLEKTGQRDLRGERTIEGPVVTLGYDGRGAREVTIMAEGIGRVECTLNEEQYQAAGLAHLAQHTVKVMGKLVKRGKGERYTLTSPRNFQVNQP